MPSETKKGFRFSLSTNILIGLLLGVFVGLFFGEYSARLQILGDAFIKLLQMSILPYIVVSIIAGIGGLSFGQAKSLARKAGVLLLLFWAVGFFMIQVQGYRWGFERRADHRFHHRQPVYHPAGAHSKLQKII